MQTFKRVLSFASSLRPWILTTSPTAADSTGTLVTIIPHSLENYEEDIGGDGIDEDEDDEDYEDEEDDYYENEGEYIGVDENDGQ